MFPQGAWQSLPQPSETAALQLQQTMSAPTVPERSQEPVEGRFSNEVFQCERCQKTFPKQFELTKHELNHSKPEKCDLCSHEVARPKDLNRHYWVKHQEYAEEKKIPKDQKKCECGYKGRSDHVTRHRRLKKHSA